MNPNYDVIVVGAGGAGLAAACAARAANAKTLVLERASLVGGSTAISGGVFYAAGTSVQRRCGIDDSWAEMERYYLTLNQYRVEPALVRILAQHAAPAVEWLISIGVRFPDEFLYESGVDGVRRGHAASGAGAAIVEGLHREALRLGAAVWTSSRVTSLVRENRRVVGVRVRGERGDERAIRSRAVVLATGGFGHNSEFVRRYYPSAAQWGSRMWAASCPGADGAGIALGLQVGAGVTGADRGLLLITPAFERVFEVHPPPWLVYANRDGRRFVRESAPYVVMSGLVRTQPDGIAFAVFDEAALRESTPSPEVQIAIQSGLVSRYQWSYEHVQKQVVENRAACAETLEALAVRCGIDREGLAHTVMLYNADCERGCDSSFGKERWDLRPIREAPFYAVQLIPAIICLTSAGLMIDPLARVLKPGGMPIPGLYAAGETTGGVLGECYVGSGNSIANAVVFGRIAGAGAATALA